MLSLVRRSKLQVANLSRSMSFKVRVGAVQQPEVPISKQQRLQQTWTISGTHSLEKLRVATPGLTYVSVAPTSFFEDVAKTQGCSLDQLVAVARVSSDATDLLGRAEIFPRGSNRLLVGFSLRSPQGWPVEKPAALGQHLLTELFVREDSELRNIGAFGGGDLVVDGVENGSVLVNDRPYGKIKLAALRGSRVFVTQEQAIRLNEVDLFAAQGGQLSLSTTELVAKKRVRVAVAGSWDDSNVTVRASKLSTPSLRVAVAGFGNVRFASISDEAQCSCESQALAVAGSGRIDTGDVASQRAKVAVAGPGTVTLQTSDSLTFGSFGAAKVNYLEPEPKRVWGGLSSLRAANEATKAQRTSEHDAIASATPPTRESAFEDRIGALHRWWWAPWSPYHPHGFHREAMGHYKRWRSDENSY